MVPGKRKKVQKESQSDENALEEIEQEYEVEDDLGPAISEKLVKVISTMAKAKLSEEKIKEKMEKYKQPQNCELKVPKVNPEIWAMMEHGSKSVDLKIQKAQKMLLKATFALTNVCNELIENSGPEKKNMLREITDAMALILKTSNEMSLERRGKIVNAQNVNRKYRKLASGEIPVTSQLLGDDLKSAFTTIESASKLGHEFTQSSKGQKFFPNFKYQTKNWDMFEQRRGRGRGAYRSRPFFPPRGRPYSRGRGNWQQKTSANP